MPPIFFRKMKASRKITYSHLYMHSMQCAIGLLLEIDKESYI